MIDLDFNAVPIGKAERIVRVGPHRRKLWRFCFYVYVCWGLLALVVFFVDSPPHAIGNPWPGWVVGILSLAIAAVGSWGSYAQLQAYQYERIEFDGRHVTHRTAAEVVDYRRRDVIEARWRLRSSPRLILKLATGERRIEFSKFLPEDQLWMIRYFHHGLPLSIQRDWAMFCAKKAIPLRDRLHDPSPRTGEISVTRRRWDWIFLPVIALTAVAAIALASRLNEPKLYFAPFQMTAFWLLWRFTTPKQGIVTRTIGSQPGLVPWLLFLICWGAVGLAGIHFGKHFAEGRFANPDTVSWVVLALWFTVVMLAAFVMDRSQREQDLALTRRAPVEWDSGERPAS